MKCDSFSFSSRCGSYVSHSGLLSAASSVDVDEVVRHNIVCTSNTTLALSIENSLSLYEVGPLQLSDPLIEVDFDHDIVSLAWDLSESCLVVGDCGGSVHLVTSNGLIMFSKKIVTGKILHAMNPNAFFPS